MDSAFSPDEGLGGFVVVGDEGLDMGDEFRDALERSSVEGFGGKDREPDFDLVEPGGVRRREAEMHVFVTLQPHVAFGLMGREIVEHDMDFAIRMIGDDLVHEVEEFDAPPTFVMASDDLAAGKIEAANGVVVPLRL